jgi:tyrosine-protein kinase Etk/Wzc
MVTDVVVTERDRHGVPGRGAVELLTLAAENKRTLLLVPVLCTLLGLGIALLVPDQYTAVTQLLPPQQSKSTASMALGQLGDLASLVGKDAIQSSSAIFVTLLQSRTVADRLISRFDLMHIYKTSRLSQCRIALTSRTQIATSKQGVITIHVRDRDPGRAAELANAYVQELSRLNQTLAIGEAAQRRLFFEMQESNARVQLEASEDLLKATQKATGIIQLDAQGKVYTAASSQLRAAIAAKEVQLEEMRGFATVDNPDFIGVRNNVETLRSKLRQLENAPSAGSQITTAKMADASVEYVRRLREVKYHEAVFEVLAKQLEAARIDEAKSAALIQVIDVAVVPDHKSDPSRALITLTGTVVGLVIVCLWIGGRQALGQWQSDPQIRQQLESLKNSLPRWSFHSGVRPS